MDMDSLYSKYFLHRHTTPKHYVDSNNPIFLVSVVLVVGKLVGIQSVLCNLLGWRAL